MKTIAKKYWKITRIFNAYKNSNILGAACLSIFLPVTFFIGFVEEWDAF